MTEPNTTLALQERTKQAAIAAAAILADLQVFVVDSDEKAEQLAKVGKEAKRYWQAWEDVRKPIAVSIDASKRALQDQFNPILNGYTEIMSLARTKISAWLQARKQTQRELAEAAAEAHAAGAAPVAVAALVKASAAPSQVAGTRSRETWRGIVTDATLLVRAVADGKAASNLVVPNQSAIDKLARETRGRVQVPGIHFESETNTAFV